MAQRKTGFFIGEAIQFGWGAWKRQWLAWSGVVITALVTPYLPGAFGMALGDEAGWFTILLLIITGALSILVSMGLLRISLKAQAGESIQLTDLFGEWRLLPGFTVASILYGIIVFGGLVLFILPGFLWAIMFQYYAFFVLEGKSPIDALKESARITAGKKWDLFAFQYVLEIVVSLGLLLFGLGILVALPVSLVANAVVYWQLQEQSRQRKKKR